MIDTKLRPRLSNLGWRERALYDVSPSGYATLVSRPLPLVWLMHTEYETNWTSLKTLVDWAGVRVRVRDSDVRIVFSGCQRVSRISGKLPSL